MGDVVVVDGHEEGKGAARSANVVGRVAANGGKKNGRFEEKAKDGRLWQGWGA